MAAENLSRKTVAPQLNFKDVFCCVGVNPLPFGDKTPNKPVVALSTELGVGIRIV